MLKRGLYGVIAATLIVGIAGCSTPKNKSYLPAAKVIQHKFSYQSDIAVFNTDYENALWHEGREEKRGREMIKRGQWTVSRMKTAIVMEPRLSRDGQLTTVPVEVKVPYREYREIVHFDFDKSYLKKDALKTLEGLPLKEADSFVIDGHTDAKGSDGYNDKLSIRRANAVREWLVSKGINKSLITVAGHGKREPDASNSDEQGRALNRRATIILNISNIKKGDAQ